MDVMDEVVDYRDLVARFSFTEHARRADDYFSGFDANSTLARKPFAALDEVSDLCAGIGAVLAGMDLFSGARVLEFGAGTCWFSRILAMLRCEVVAVDVSGKALDIGRRLIESDPMGLNVEFVRLESERLPFPDGSFDRVLCFDALHHVPDQGFAVSEFARVLKRPGIIALHEPGPNHSRGAQSQYEMRKFDVIEGDVHIEQLIDRARDAGITDVAMATYSTRPVFTELHQFNAFLASPSGSHLAQAHTAQMHADFQNRRVCFLKKSGSDEPIDSRRRDGLAVTFDLKAEHHADHVRVHGLVRNTGTTIWRPSSSPIDGPGKGGDVNIAVHLSDREGTQHDHYYARRLLSEVPVYPGESVPVDFTIPYPDLRRFRFDVDLVAEHVSWFETAGGKPFVIDLDRS